MSDPDFIHPPDPGSPPPLPAPAISGSTAAASSPTGRLSDPSIPHEQRTYCLLMHASIVLLHFLAFFSFIVPLVMWLARKDTSRFIDDHGRETLNFHLSITLYGLIGFALIPLCGVGVAVLVFAYILAIVGGIMPASPPAAPSISAIPCACGLCGEEGAMGNGQWAIGNGESQTELVWRFNHTETSKFGSSP